MDTRPCRLPNSSPPCLSCECGAATVDGEPSDAQVKAAVTTWRRLKRFMSTEGAMRAALVAALNASKPRHEPTTWCNGIATVGPNPYLEDLYGDSSLHLMCKCERDSAADDL